MDIEKKRRREINRIKSDLLQYRASYRRATSSEQVKKFKSLIEEATLKIKEVEEGKYDSSINLEYKTNMIDSKKRREEIKEKRMQKKIKKEIQRERCKQHSREVWRDMNREKFYNQQYERFMNTHLPKRLQDNINRFPENKGYIYRGVWFFGKSKASCDLTRLTMFEKKNNMLITHKYFNVGTPNSYYEQQVKKLY